MPPTIPNDLPPQRKSFIKWFTIFEEKISPLFVRKCNFFWQKSSNCPTCGEDDTLVSFCQYSSSTSFISKNHSFGIWTWTWVMMLAAWIVDNLSIAKPPIDWSRKKKLSILQRMSFSIKINGRCNKWKGFSAELFSSGNKMNNFSSTNCSNIWSKNFSRMKRHF